ncbi:MAG TPA: hypothetical protein PLV90_10185, partial [Methanoculleus sp.]|nr:hypothetical protein [Methanoculleus sp.]
MGWEQFTIKMLQEALGLSYYQTYRILHGYTSRGTTYSGLLEKCPAVSFFDTMVTEDVEGYAVRRREHLFSFDRTVYRRWAHGGGVWLDEDRDDGSDPRNPGRPPDRSGGTARCDIAAGLPQDSGTGCNDKTAGNGAGSAGTCTDREKHLSLSTKVQQNTHTVPGTGSGVGECAGVCEIRNAGTDPEIPAPRGEKSNPTPFNRPLAGIPGCNVLKRDARRGPALQEPLSGVLDHREFSRVRVELGRCDICDTGKAVYRSREARANLCEGCYARLVREGNAREGVR